jgi:hypothetical protein
LTRVQKRLYTLCFENPGKAPLRALGAVGETRGRPEALQAGARRDTVGPTTSMFSTRV